MWCRPPCQWRWFILWMIVFMCLYVLKPKVLWPLNGSFLHITITCSTSCKSIQLKVSTTNKFYVPVFRKGKKICIWILLGVSKGWILKSKMIQHSMQHCKLWYIQDLLSFKVYMYIYLNIYLYWCLYVILLTDTFDNHNLNTLCTSSAIWAREL